MSNKNEDLIKEAYLSIESNGENIEKYSTIITDKDIWGELLDKAVQNGNGKLAKLFSERVDEIDDELTIQLFAKALGKEEMNRDRATWLEIALSKGNRIVGEKELSELAVIQAMRGRAGVVKVLIDNGATLEGQSALAKFLLKKKLKESIKIGDRAMVDVLLKMGVKTTHKMREKIEKKGLTDKKENLIGKIDERFIVQIPKRSKFHISDKTSKRFLEFIKGKTIVSAVKGFINRIRDASKNSKEIIEKNRGAYNFSGDKEVKNTDKSSNKKIKIEEGKGKNMNTL